MAGHQIFVQDVLGCSQAGRRVLAMPQFFSACAFLLALNWL